MISKIKNKKNNKIKVTNLSERQDAYKVKYNNEKQYRKFVSHTPGRN